MTLPIWAEEQKYIYCFPANQLLFPGVQNYSLEGWDKKKNGRKIFCGLKNRERYSKHAYVSSPAPFLSKLNEDTEVGVRRGRLGQGNWGKLKKALIPFIQRYLWRRMFPILFWESCLLGLAFSFLPSFLLQLYLHGLEFNIEECIYIYSQRGGSAV